MEHLGRLHKEMAVELDLEGHVGQWGSSPRIAPPVGEQSTMAGERAVSGPGSNSVGLVNLVVVRKVWERSWVSSQRAQVQAKLLDCSVGDTAGPHDQSCSLLGPAGRGMAGCSLEPSGLEQDLAAVRVWAGITTHRWLFSFCLNSSRDGKVSTEKEFGFYCCVASSSLSVYWSPLHSLW